MLDNIAAELNARPRKTLNWRTPAEALEKLLSDQIRSTRCCANRLNPPHLDTQEPHLGTRHAPEDPASESAAEVQHQGEQH